MVSRMPSRCSFALPFAILLSACSSSSSGSGGTAASAPSPSNAPGTSPPVDAADSSEPTDAGADGTGVDLGLGAASCPARGDAATCLAPPSGVASGPGPNLPDLGYWVGCQATSCSSATACTTCSCVDGDGGASWQCTTTNGLQPETDAEPTPYCALYSGPIDAGDLDDAGPFEQCTPEYPSCTPPYPESPGWQCCLTSTAGSLSEISCMPHDAGAYAGGGPHP
jgi:hypothetical protein